MDRRDALRILGAVGAGVPALAGLSAEDLHAAARDLHARAPRPLQVLNPHQNATVLAIAGLIIPDTDTPGARATRVNEFIDVLLAEWFDPADRDRFLAGLADVDTRARTLAGKDFVDCPADRQTELLTAMDQEVARLRDLRRDGTSTESLNQNFFYTIKRLTLVGHYTSETGATQELHYQIIPNRFDGCAPLETGGRGEGSR